MKLWMFLGIVLSGLAGCGGGDSSPAAGPPPLRTAVAPAPIDASALLDYAEFQYPALFPHHAADQSLSSYVYRRYPETGNYVGMGGGTVAVMGPDFGNAGIVTLGPSEAFRCTIFPAECGGPPGPHIVLQPADTAVAQANLATLRVGAVSRSSMSYQWYRNGLAMAGQTTPMLRIASATANDAADYKVKVTDGTGTSMSNTARLSVSPVPVRTTRPAYRAIVQARTGSQLRLPPAETDWTIRYAMVVPPLPSGATWDHASQVYYAWGDVDFDAYGAGGPYAISSYIYNQIVPQLMIGWALSGNDAGYAPKHSFEKTWVIQSQYYWRKGETSFASTGAIVPVNPGDEVTTEIQYAAATGKITARIASGAGSSTLVLDRPFPNEPGLFASWKDFFAKAERKSGAGGVWSQPVVNVETYDVDQETVCRILPLTLLGVTLPGVGAASSAFATSTYGGLACPGPVARLLF